MKAVLGFVVLFPETLIQALVEFAVEGGGGIGVGRAFAGEQPDGDFFNVAGQFPEFPLGDLAVAAFVFEDALAGAFFRFFL